MPVPTFRCNPLFNYLSVQCRPQLKPTGCPVFQCSLKPPAPACDFKTRVALFKLTACECRWVVGSTCLLPPQHLMPLPALSKHSLRHRQQLDCSNPIADASLQPAHRLSSWKQTCLMVGTMLRACHAILDLSFNVVTPCLACEFSFLLSLAAA